MIMQVDTQREEAAAVNLALGRVARALRRARGSSEFGAGTISALATLARCGPMRLGDLAAREQVAAPTMSRIVAALEGAGYVQRDADPDDGRARLFAATEGGEQLVAGVTSERIGALAERMEQLTPEQRRGLVDGVLALERAFAQR